MTKLIALFALVTIQAFAASGGMEYSADQLIQHEKTNTVELIGNAKVVQGNQEVTGDKIILNHKTGKMQVEGNGRYTAATMSVDLPKSKATKH